MLVVLIQHVLIARPLLAQETSQPPSLVVLIVVDQLGTSYLNSYSPLLSGAYTRPDRALHASYRSPANERKLGALAAVAREKNITVNQAVLSWMIHGKNAVIPLITGSTTAQLRENLDSLRVTVTDEEITAVRNSPSAA